MNLKPFLYALNHLVHKGKVEFEIVDVASGLVAETIFAHKMGIWHKYITIYYIYK